MAELDLEDVRAYRNQMKSRCVMASKNHSFPRFVLDFSLGSDDIFMPSSLDPMMWSLLTPEEEIRLGYLLFSSR